MKKNRTNKPNISSFSSTCVTIWNFELTKFLAKSLKKLCRKTKMLSWNTEFQPCPTNHFDSIDSQFDFRHQFYIWWKVMQIGHSDAFCGSFFSVWKPAPNWIMKKRNISSSHWCRPEALGKPRLVVTSSNFCFQNQMDSLFSKARVKNLPFFLKIQIFQFEPEIFHQIKVVSRSARPRATQPGHWYFCYFFHLSTKKCPYMAQNTVFGPETNRCGL